MKILVFDLKDVSTLVKLKYLKLNEFVCLYVLPLI